VSVTREADGESLYFNSWITNHSLTPQRVIQVVAAGRGRWKTENENHNVLKTRGYHLEHNFGQGQRHLATVLLTLNLLAFLFHTVLQLVDERYQRARLQLRESAIKMTDRCFHLPSGFSYQFRTHPGLHSIELVVYRSH